MRSIFSQSQFWSCHVPVDMEGSSGELSFWRGWLEADCPGSSPVSTAPKTHVQPSLAPMNPPVFLGLDSEEGVKRIKNLLGREG